MDFETQKAYYLSFCEAVSGMLGLSLPTKLKTAIARRLRKNEFSTDWTSHNFPIWEVCFDKFRNKIFDILEVGSWEGRSAIFFLEFFRKSRITCIDTFTGTTTSPMFQTYREEAAHCERRFDFNLAPYGDRARKIKNKSAVGLNILAKAHETFDLIYIDGDHSREAVLADSSAVWPLLRPGGLLVWDDYAWQREYPRKLRPEDAIDYFLSLHAGQYTELHRGYQIIIQRGAAEGRTRIGED